jgi:uncharacterized protein YdiU (UPF0061 family)
MADKTYSPPIYELGPDFYDEVAAAPFPKAILRYKNNEAAESLFLDQFSEDEWKSAFWAFQPLPGNIRKPLALRYHGHQFGIYNPELGDGRGFLFAQFQNGSDLWDLGTKGSGATPYSRQGDGRLTLKGAFREILCTEMLQSLGVNTSRTLSVFETGENLIRYDEPSPTRSAVLVRRTRGHIRIGTFQRLAFLQEIENIQSLTDYCVRHYYPEITNSEPEKRAEAFFKAVVQRNADLVASFMMAGFVHGVLNTDNINITGESFDYGPYRFLPHYDPKFTAAYFDRQGLYSFGRQPISFLFALEQLAQSLAMAYPETPYGEILEGFSDQFNMSVQKYFLRRLNLKGNSRTSELLALFFEFMESKNLSFEQTFFDLNSGWNEDRLSHSPQAEHYTRAEALKNILVSFEMAQKDLLVNPYFKNPSPQTLLIEEIEELWKPIADQDDWQPFEEKLKALRSFRGHY